MTITCYQRLKNISGNTSFSDNNATACVIYPATSGNNRFPDMKPLRALMDFKTDLHLQSFLMNKHSRSKY